MTTFDQHAQEVVAQYNAAGDIYIGTPAMPRPVDPEVLAAAEQQLAALPLKTIPDPAPLPEGSRRFCCKNQKGRFLTAVTL
jgi:hypothetical protein